ncbi:response regulator [Cohnella zeiphila]|uniref:Response regulator n=1 Tax=Cohnella zeiphila TaxID=2761120 RepID=A0A7X0SQN4_9BACL|nr:response regulator [Cohnella zeiphila]MBB6733319.1 response regulator [Cohnella zeiphila]
MAIRVLIADDEPMILKGLRKLIPWAERGMEIVGQAGDGDELAKRIAELGPDVVISDISMPHRSGIDILRTIGERELPVKMIFISAYQEFAYAKEALSLGAVDYLIKPIEKEQLGAALDKAAALIREQGEEIRRKDRLSRLEEKSRTEELQMSLSRLADGTLSPQADAFQALNEAFRAPFFTALAFSVERLKGSPGRWTEQERKLVDFAIDNMLGELVVAPRIGHFFGKPDCIMLVVAHADAGQPYETAQDVKGKIKDYLKLEVSFGIGQPVRELGRLAESCRQAEQALGMKYFKGLGKVLPYAEGAPAASVEGELYQARTEIVRGLAERNRALALGALDRLLALIRSGTEGSQTLAVTTAFSSMLAVVQEIRKSGAAIGDGGFDIQGMQTRLDDCETFAEMAQGVRDMIEELYERLDNRAGNRDKMLIARVKTYIEEHYAEELTLESAASVAYMNPYYFSAFFKKQMGVNFKPYVTEVRMRHAVRLLTGTDLMMYEVAEKVGYLSARHFSDVFKKTFGRLPNEYRQSLR